MSEQVIQNNKVSKASVTSRTKTRTMVQIAMLAAVAGVVMVFEFPLPFLAPPFYKMDFSEIPVLIGAFAMGPLAGVAIEFIKILVKLVLHGTSTVFVGDLANFLMGCALVVPAGLWYKHKKTKKSALIGMSVGTILMVVLGCVLNAYVLLPTYAVAFGAPVSSFVDMGAAVNPAINNIFTLVILAVAPFNLIKGVVVSLVTLLLYKRIRVLLKGE